jgi:hypothetical protein
LRFIAERELANMTIEEHDASHYTFQELLDKCIEEVNLPAIRSCSRATTSYARTCSSYWTTS